MGKTGREGFFALSPILNRVNGEVVPDSKVQIDFW